MASNLTLLALFPLVFLLRPACGKPLSNQYAEKQVLANNVKIILILYQLDDQSFL